MKMPKTCWAVFKRRVINLRSCCIWLVKSVESMMMHGLANPKNEMLVFIILHHVYRGKDEHMHICSSPLYLLSHRCVKLCHYMKRVRVKYTLRWSELSTLSSCYVFQRQPATIIMERCGWLPSVPTRILFYFFFLIFMDPCIVVWLSRNNQQDATLY